MRIFLIRKIYFPFIKIQFVKSIIGGEGKQKFKRKKIF